jgi:hypothetical protein
MKGILDKYDKVDSGWIVRYKVERDNLIVYQHVMLHPNQINYAELDKEVDFRIESCPNLQNGGEWEDMAIIDTGEPKRIREIMEKFKNKLMFPKSHARAKESLVGVKIPNPRKGNLVRKDNEWVVRYQTENGEKELPLYHKDNGYLNALYLTEDNTEVHFEIVDEFTHPRLFEDVDFMSGVESAKLID